MRSLISRMLERTEGTGAVKFRFVFLYPCGMPCITIPCKENVREPEEKRRAALRPIFPVISSLFARSSTKEDDAFDFEAKLSRLKGSLVIHTEGDSVVLLQGIGPCSLLCAVEAELPVLIEEVDGHPAGAAILPADREDPLGSFLRISSHSLSESCCPNLRMGFPFWIPAVCDSLCT